MSRLHSPQIVHYVESGKSSRGDVYWIVMELIQGEPLDKILERDGPFPESEVIKASQKSTVLGPMDIRSIMWFTLFCKLP